MPTRSRTVWARGCDSWKTQPSRTRVLAQNLALALASVLLAPGLLEVGFRVAGWPGTPAPAASGEQGEITCRRDSLFGWIFPPNASGPSGTGALRTLLTTNSLGIRGPELPPADSPGVTVLVLGDSYAFGCGVADSLAFPRVLEKTLRAAHPGLRIDVINTGMPGYSIYQQRRMLEAIRSRTRVDAVISTFSLANDPVDELRISRYAPDRLAQYGVGSRDSLSLVARLVRGSRLLTWADERTQYVQYALANISGPAVALARRSLQSLCDEVESARIPLLLVVVPRHGEVVFPSGPMGWANQLLMSKLRPLPREVARARGIPILDLTEALRSVEKREPAYLLHDVHWTPAGNRAVAAAIADSLPAAWFERHP